MKKIVKEAARISSNLWGVDAERVLKNDSRKGNIPKAKRMLIYYLVVFADIPHNQIKKYIKNETHANSIYHCNKFSIELKTKPDVNDKFCKFKNEMKAFSLYGAEFEKKKQELIDLKVDLNNLKK